MRVCEQWKMPGTSERGRELLFTFRNSSYWSTIENIIYLIYNVGSLGQELARRIDSEMLLEWCKWSAVLEDRKYREVKSDGRRNFMGGNENSNKETGI